MVVGAAFQKMILLCYVMAVGSAFECKRKKLFEKKKKRNVDDGTNEPRARSINYRWNTVYLKAVPFRTCSIALPIEWNVPLNNFYFILFGIFRLGLRISTRLSSLPTFEPVRI